LVISHLSGCADDLVKHGVNGYVFQTGNSQEIANYLNILSNNPTQRLEMGKESLRIINEYSIEKTAQGIINGITSIVNQES
jgi:glycosyltransferase involved in cell wall biosynthesis